MYEQALVLWWERHCNVHMVCVSNNVCPVERMCAYVRKLTEANPGKQYRNHVGMYYICVCAMYVCICTCATMITAQRQWCTVCEWYIRNKACKHVDIRAYVHIYVLYVCIYIWISNGWMIQNHVCIHNMCVHVYVYMYTKNGANVFRRKSEDNDPSAFINLRHTTHFRWTLPPITSLLLLLQLLQGLFLAFLASRHFSRRAMIAVLLLRDFCLLCCIFRRPCAMHVPVRVCVCIYIYIYIWCRLWVSFQVPLQMETLHGDNLETLLV